MGETQISATIAFLAGMMFDERIEYRQQAHNMRWDVHSKGSTISYIGNSESVPVTEAVFALWQKYIEEAAPKNADIAWDHLRVEMWLDSGRIILFPSPSPYRFRVEKAACQVICTDLLHFYETLIEAGIPDEKFELALNRKELEVAGLLYASVNTMKLPERLGRHSVKVLYYGADLQKPIRVDNLSA